MALFCATVSRIWRAFALQPPSQRDYQVVKRSSLCRKGRDIAELTESTGLGVVSCVSLRGRRLRRSTGLSVCYPCAPVRLNAGPMTTKGHGTTSLFAALDVKRAESFGAFRTDPPLLARNDPGILN